VSGGLKVNRLDVRKEFLCSIVADNQFLSPDPVTFNLTPITLYSVDGAAFTGNTISGWGSSSPTSARPYYDYQGLSSGLTASGNTVAP